MKIPFVDLNNQHNEIKIKIDRAISRVMNRGDFILGEDVKSFENEFSKFCHSRYAIGVNSGTDALFLALLSLGIGKKDEVIVPDFTYIATAFSVSFTGATPVFVDIDEKTYNIDAHQIRKKITKNTKAIIPVHLFGQPANMPEILKIAREFNLKVIEDVAQAHGATIRIGKTRPMRTGGIGDIGCFSFYPTKNLGALGDAGMIVTNRKDVYRRLLMLRDCGRKSKYRHAIIGYNSRLDSIQAAILREKLQRLEQWNALRQEKASIYNRLLKDVEDVIIPCPDNSLGHVYHAYTIRVKKRDKVFKQLKKNGIGAIIYYPIPLHLQKAYIGLGYKKKDFPVAERLSREVISLPIHPHLKTSQIEFIVKVLKGILR